MPKIRDRTTDKAKWSTNSLEKAVELIDREGYSIRKASKAIGIPFSTLQKRYNRKSMLEPRLGRGTVFTPEVEEELTVLIKKIANIFYGCTANQIRKLAFEYAESLNLKHNFNKISKMAGRDWFSGFMARNNIPVQKSKRPSKNNTTPYNMEEVESFYESLEEIMNKYKFISENIYNCDETDMIVVENSGKILATKGQNGVKLDTGMNITLMFAMSAAGRFIPPMFIYQRKRMSPLLRKDGPTGAIYKCSDNGCMNENLFLEWLIHFKEHAKPSADEPVLLILDNHASHISLSIYEYCKSNCIHLLSLPPHTSRKMQPLEVSFFGPFKTAYKLECDLHMKKHFQDNISPYDVASLVGKALNSVAIIAEAESGFRATGILPLYPKILSEEDFMVTDSPISVCSNL